MKLLYSLILSSLSFSSFAQSKTVYLKTPGINCEDCETYVENRMMRVEGIAEIDVNPYAKNVRIVFLPSRISLQEVKYSLADLGFVVDDVLPDSPTYKNMPECCRAAAKTSYELALAESKKPKVPVETPKKDTIKAPAKPSVPVKPVPVKPVPTKPIPLKPVKPTTTKPVTKPKNS